MRQHDHLPPGRQPYDSLNGARIGALAGGVAGMAAAAIAGQWWLVIAGVIAGGAVGHRSARRSLTARDDRPPQGRA